MRLSSQSCQFLFQFPSDFISPEVNERLKNYMDKNWIPYTDPISYLNSTIKECVFPSITYEGSEQTHKFGKKIVNGITKMTLRNSEKNVAYFPMPNDINVVCPAD